MFDWVSSTVKNFRIALDFPKFEAQARAQHIARAALRFSTDALERDANARMTEPRIEAEIRFGVPIKETQLAMSRLPSVITEKQTMLSLFDRSYKEELDFLYCERKALVAKCHAFRDERSKAYNELAQANSAISSWHSKSRGTWFGNGGKKLPKHSLFGQSFGDLDGHKVGKNTATSEISRCNTEINNLRDRIQELTCAIDKVKTDHQRMFDLRKQGHNRFRLQQEIRYAQNQHDEQYARIRHLEIEKVDFLQAAKHRLGVVSLDADIERIINLRSDFIQAFDAVKSLEQRKLVHREVWLMRHK